MPAQEQGTVWKERFQQIKKQVDSIRLPDVDEEVSQDSEWCYVNVNGKEQRIRFHDYDLIYEVPGLYESIFYKALRCNSPYRVTSLLADVMKDFDDSMEDLRVLDVGAGNGMVGDELAHRGVETMVGIDIIDAAKHATERDRPGLYQDYLVADLTELREQDEEKLRKYNLNCLTTVAALGFGDIPPRAFLKALDVVDTPAWLAFNIKVDFIDDKDDTGFSGLIHQLSREGIIQIEAFRRYPHRLSIGGDELHYVALVAQKLRDVPDHIMQRKD